MDCVFSYWDRSESEMINCKYRIETGDRVEYILSDKIKIICYNGVDKNLETDLDKILTGF